VGCKFFFLYDGTSFSHDLVVFFTSNFFTRCMYVGDSSAHLVVFSSLVLCMLEIVVCILVLI
jgi:hypothetical protein